MKNYYQILEVPPDASQDMIKEQYRFLVQAWHPDKFPNPAQKKKAEEKIKEINAAYEILRNPTKRSEYDSSTASKRSDHQKEYRRQEEVKATQRRAEDERCKREEAVRQKEEQFRKESADRKKTEASRDRVKVFINGKEHILSIDQLVHASAECFLEGESIHDVFFATRAHVEAFVNNIALPSGYEIHLITLAGQEQRFRTGREWEVKSVKVFVDRNGSLEERTVKETDLVRASISYYFDDLSTYVWEDIIPFNLKDVKAAVRKCRENNWAIVVDKFAN